LYFYCIFNPNYRDNKIISIFANMKPQESHIEILTGIATGYGEGYTAVNGALIKVAARDIIEAGRRLEELGVFNFDGSKGDNVITVNIIDNAD